MTPHLYFYKQEAAAHLLYVFECSTLQGLKTIPPDTEVNLLEAGATRYKKYGFATEKELPNFETVADLIAFFIAEGEFGLCLFNITLVGLGSLRSHDDSACHFVFENKSDLINTVKQLAPPAQQQLILSKLFEQPGVYFQLLENGSYKAYYDFDQYLRESDD